MPQTWVIGGLFVIICVDLLLGCEDEAVKRAGPQFLTPEEMAADLDFVLTTIEDVHPNMYAFIDEDEFLNRLDRARAALAEPMSSLDFYKVVGPLVAALQDAHTLAVPMEAVRGELPQEGNILPLVVNRGRGIEITPEGLLVKWSPTNLPPGSIIVSINGRPIHTILKELNKYLPNEHPDREVLRRMPFFLFFHWLEYGSSDVYVIEARRPDGKVEEYRIEGQPLDAIQQKVAERASFQDEPYSYRYLTEHGVGLLTTNTCPADEDFRKFLEVTFREIRDKQVNGLIVDLRGNGGGDSRAGDMLYSYLSDQPFRQFSRFDAKISRQYLDQRGDNPVPHDAKEYPIGTIKSLDHPEQAPSDVANRFCGRVYALIGPGTLSGGTTLATLLQDYGRAILAGEETGGLASTYGDCLGFTLPHSQLHLMVPCKYFVRPNGDTGRHGVIPDFEVKQTPEDAAQDVDTVLQFVLDMIGAAQATTSIDTSRQGHGGGC